MKKSSLVLSLLLVQLSYGQIKKGALLLGPTLGFWHNKVTNTSDQSPDISSTNRTTSFNGTLRAGYFVTDKIALGIIGAYTGNKMTSTAKNPNLLVGTGVSNLNIAAFGVFARSYKLFNENKFAFFGELKGLYEIGNSKTVNKTQQVGFPLMSNETSSEIVGLELGLSPGFVYFITKRTGLEASFGSIAFKTRTSQFYYKGEKTTEINDTSFNIAFNMFSLGVIFYVSK